MYIADFRNKRLRFQKIEELKKQGVIFIDEEGVYIEQDVKIGKGTVIYPNTYIFHSTQIGKECQIWPNVIITNSQIGNFCELRAFSRISNSKIRCRCIIGPSSDIHDNSLVYPEAELAHGEIVRSFIGRGTKAKHFGYIGDAHVGYGCNIGAGTVFCNFDGIRKNRTIIEPEAFVGSGCMLVPSKKAPLRIGSESIIAAGSVVTRNIPCRTLVIARGQKHGHTPPDVYAEGEVHKTGYARKIKEGWSWGNKSRKTE